MPQQVRFGLVTSQQVIGALKATGSTDPDVLAAAKDELASTYKPLKWFGIWGLVTGTLATALVLTAFIGIPVLIFGFWALRRAKKNMATLDAAFADYTSRLGSGEAVPAMRGLGVRVG